MLLDPEADGVPSFGDNDDYDLERTYRTGRRRRDKLYSRHLFTQPDLFPNRGHTSDHIATLGIPKSFDIMTLSDGEESAINAAGLTWTVSSVKTRAIHEDIYTVNLKFDELLASLPGDEYDFTVS